MQLRRKSLHKPGTNLSSGFFLNFNLLLDGIRDGFVLSFSKKKKKCICIFNILRLFEIMIMIFKKSIRIVKGTSNQTFTMYAIFLSDAYTDIRIKYVLYKSDMIKMRCKEI